MPNSGLALPWCMPKGMRGMAGSLEFWSVRKVRGTLSVSSMMKRKHHSLNFFSFPHLKRGARPMVMGKASVG